MIYDFSKTFHENIKKGPQYSGSHLDRFIPPAHEWISLLDYSVMSPIGLFASPFTATAQGVELASRLGFDVITWKTVRSKSHEPYAWPNVTFVQQDKNNIVATQKKTLSLANSIGNASYPLEPTLQKIKKGLGCLQKGQILISSIYGTGQTHKEIIDDFVYLAERVTEVGVHAIELNCSCPNVLGLYYKDTDFMRTLVAAIRQAVHLPIIIKVGLCSPDELEQLMMVSAQAGARGIAGINAIPTKVSNKVGMSFFGTKRAYAGLSGDAIRRRALEWIQSAAIINKKHNLNIALLGGGGIITFEQFDQFLDRGAQVGMTATGALLDPQIAMNYHRKRYEKNHYRDDT